MSVSKIWKGLFDYDMAAYQRTCGDLVVYSPEVGSVKIEWPTVNGHRVLPRYVGKFLQTKNIKWPCFCTRTMPLLADINSVSCRIYTAMDNPGPGRNIAACHYSPARCQFFIDLDAVFESTSLMSEYDVPRWMTIPKQIWMHGLEGRRWRFPNTLERQENNGGVL
ncbi:hypothetical protein K438DRAFT_1789326 [Mycena galopus ATCC 62051]|nr:hypothetical protein K438DRAFT_1789326 [Mycena galopus ATCC 62051]